MAEVNYPAILEAAWQQHLAPREQNAPTVISTFAGCGGSSLGYSMAGFRELLAVEWDDNAVATFRLNFPDVPVYHGDIAKLSVEECMRLAGLSGPRQLDVLDGSPPCQGFSTAGKRQIDDPRNQLFREYVRLLQGLQPRAFVMENVSGMVKGKMKLVFAEVIRELKASGYKVSARLMNAMYFHVPQSRQRMIFIGVREDLGKEPSHPKAQTRPIVARDALAGVVIDPEEREMLLAAGQRYVVYQEWPWIPLGKKKIDLPGHTSGFNACKWHPNRVGRTVTKTDGHLSMHGSMHWAEQRRFTLAEFKRFSSFPEAFQFVGGWGPSVERIGNSVPPLFMRAIAGHLRERIL